LEFKIDLQELSSNFNKILQGRGNLNKINNKVKWIAAALIMIAVTIGAGAYAENYGSNEIVHFWIAVPAGDVEAQMVMRGAGPPISMSPVHIDLNARGILKNALQPQVEALSTHWIYNLGKKPVTIQMELINCSIPVRWEVNANYPYDPETRTFTQPLPPGKSIPNLGIDWVFDLPSQDDAMQNGNLGVVYDGGILLKDANTGEKLTLIPIKIGYGMDSLGGASCCD